MFNVVLVGGLRITCGSRFSTSTMGVLGIEFKSLGFREGISPRSHFTGSRCVDSYIVPGLQSGELR